MSMKTSCRDNQYVGPDTTFDTMESLNVVMNMIQDEHLRHSPILDAEVEKATKEDTTLKQLTNCIQNYCPIVKTPLR